MSIRSVCRTNLNSVQNLSSIVDTTLDCLSLRAQYWALNEKVSLERANKLSQKRDDLHFVKEVVSLKKELQREMQDPAFSKLYNKLIKGEEIL